MRVPGQLTETLLTLIEVSVHWPTSGLDGPLPNVPCGKRRSKSEKSVSPPQPTPSTADEARIKAREKPQSIRRIAFILLGTAGGAEGIISICRKAPCPAKLRGPSPQGSKMSDKNRTYEAFYIVRPEFSDSEVQKI